MRLSVYFGLSGAVLCGALLAACAGGSGGSSGGAPVPAKLPAPGSPTSPNGLGARVTLSFQRGTNQQHSGTRSVRRYKDGKTAPKYIDVYNVEGLQVAVSTTGAGATSQTIYADLSPTSPLCTDNSDLETCTLTIPALAANEQIMATEIDTLPTAENSAGYGTGFPSGSNILAIGTTTATLTPGVVTAISLGLGLVPAGGFGDRTGSFSAGVPNNGPNFQPDFLNCCTPRLVVTAGVASSGVIEGCIVDFDGDSEHLASPAPYADENGALTPTTISSNSSAITFAPIIGNGTPPPATAFTTAASIPSDAYTWVPYCFAIEINVSANLTSAAVPVITLNNNLTAISPFTLESYPKTQTYVVAPISVSPLAPTGVAVTGGVTANVLGTDNQGSNGMGAESAIGANDGNCNIGGTTYATVASNGSIGPDWTQSFTITPGTATPAGTPCTFVLYDTDTGVPSQTVSVTVGS